MKEEIRVAKLKEILKDEPYMTGVRIKYRGEIQAMNAYKIPLEYLIYNKYNGRIGSSVKSFEKEKYTLNPENEEHKKIIEDFLWESKPDRNETTRTSLARDGQQKYGIVTSNGVIIDGNRRASILNRIYRNKSKYTNVDVTHAQYFIAVILPENAQKRDIMALETRYQMGVDEKVDYNAIEKYLKCGDLLENGFDIDEIADFMSEKPKDIENYLNILDLMNKYLETYGYDGIYTRLEKREGQFVDLARYLASYTDRKAYTDWNIDESDINDLELICFDYIRASYEGKEFRNIASTNKKEAKSIFSCKKVWEDFRDTHFNETQKIEEDKVDTIRENNPEEDLSKLLKKRDLDWENKIGSKLKGNLNKSTRKLENYREAEKPEKLLMNIIDILEAIDTDVETFSSDRVESLVNEINTRTYEFKKIIKKKRKNL